MHGLGKGDGVRGLGAGRQVFPGGGQHQLNAVERVNLGSAGVVVHGHDVGLGVSSAEA